MKGAITEETNEVVAAPGSEANSASGGDGVEPEEGGGWSAPHALSPGSGADDEDKSPAENRYVVPVRGDCSSGEMILYI